MVSVSGKFPKVLFEVPLKKVFAVVELCGTQYKVSPGDLVYSQQLFGCDIHGQGQTRPHLIAGDPSTKPLWDGPLIPQASIDAVVEEQFLDGKVLAFKKRRRKNSRRLKGHRQPMTCLRILDIHGIQQAPAANLEPVAA
eukprot:jgi/Botrbrau1/12525/Bobra.0169s0067.1